MSSTNQKLSLLSLAENIVIYTAIIEMILRHFFGLTDTYSYILKLEQKTMLPILLIMRLILLLLLLYIALSYLRKRYKIAKTKHSKLKTRKQKLKDKVLILDSINNSLKWYLHCKYQDLNLRESELKKYIKLLIKKNFIEQNGFFEIRNGWIVSEIFILTKKVLIFLNKHKDIL